MSDDTQNYDRILGNISSCRDVDKLTSFIVNARKRGVKAVQDAAYHQLKSLVPAHKKESYEKAFWAMLLGYQAVLLDHGKPTIKLNKAWNAAMREGEIKVLSDWVENGHQKWALDYFVKNRRASVTAETLVLKFPDMFETKTCNDAARNLHLAKARILETT